MSGSCTEKDYRRVVEMLRKIVEGWNEIDPDAQVPESLNDGRMEDAILLLRELGVKL